MGWMALTDNEGRATGERVGDEPFDILGEALERVRAVYKATWNREPTADELDVTYDFVRPDDIELAGMAEHGEFLEEKIERAADGEEGNLAQLKTYLHFTRAADLLEDSVALAQALARQDAKASPTKDRPCVFCGTNYLHTDPACPFTRAYDFLAKWTMNGEPARLGKREADDDE